MPNAQHKPVLFTVVNCWYAGEVHYTYEYIYKQPWMWSNVRRRKYIGSTPPGLTVGHRLYLLSVSLWLTTRSDSGYTTWVYEGFSWSTFVFSSATSDVFFRCWQKVPFYSDDNRSV